MDRAGTVSARRKAWRAGPAGVEEQGIGTVGFPRNVGGPLVFADSLPEVGITGWSRSRPERAPSPDVPGSEEGGDDAVQTSEGNEARREE